VKLANADLPALARLLDEALDLPAEARVAWLDGLPAEHSHLVASLREMLSEAGQDETSVDLPALPGYCEADLDDLAPDDTAGLSPDSIVGPYRLIRELGRGGMGSVWLAERTDGTLKRQIALKLPHSSLPQRQLAERFARERDILAGLNHPHIARLYDAGVTEEGRPYLALEYVDGEPLNTYCDSWRLSIKARLELFLQVLAALQYAHGQLVVHRDLKPTNILVTPEGEVKLLDFGIAKLLTDGAAHETELTQLGGRALTPQYASPEQILGQPIGTASDVYALGVVLYELLTGSLPYRLKRDSRGALEDAILSSDVPRPSKTEVLLGNARSRSSTASKLTSLLKGDLDTIVLKALKKNAAERYATAQLFADDLRRHLAGEAVQAQPDSGWYRTGKFVRRNWLAVSAASAVVVALSVGLGIALWQTQVARTEAQTARAVQAFLLDIFQANSSNQSDPQKARLTTARELLDIGAKKVDSALSEAPEAKIQILKTLGQLYIELGLNAESAQLQRKRVALARERFGSDSVHLAEALLDLAFAVNTQLDDPEWQRALQEAEAVLDRRHDSDSLLRASLLSRLADYYQEKDLAKAVGYIDRAIAIYDERPPSRELVSALFSAATIRMLSGDYVQARTETEEAIAAAEGPAAKVSGDFLPNLYDYLGMIRNELDDLPRAEQALRRGWELSRQANGDEHVDTIENLCEYARLLVLTGRSAHDGIVMMKSAIGAMNRAKGGEELANQWYVATTYAPAVASYGRLEDGLAALTQLETKLTSIGDSVRVISVKEQQADILVKLGRTAEADRLLEEASKVLPAPGTARDKYQQRIQLVRLKLLLAQRRIAEAADLAASVFPDNAELATTAAKVLTARRIHVELALTQGDAPQASVLAAEAIAKLEASPARPYYAVREQEFRLLAGKALRQTKQAVAAERSLRKAVELGAEIYDPQRSPELADAQIALAESLLDLNRPAEARALMTKARAIHAVHNELGEQYREPLRALQVRLVGKG
jgi:serine/threonine-protein kinase